MTFAMKTVVKVILVTAHYVHEVHASDRMSTIFKIQLHDLQMKKPATLVSSIYLSIFFSIHV
jgi:hypothetical protein